MLDVQRRLAVAKFVAVLNVVVNERRFVKRFDRDGRAADDVVEPAADVIGAIGLRAVAAGEGVVGGQRDERPRVLAALGEKVVGDGFGGGERDRDRPAPGRSLRPAAVRRACGERAAPIRPAGTSVRPLAANARMSAALSMARPVARQSSSPLPDPAFVPISAAASGEPSTCNGVALLAKTRSALGTQAVPDEFEANSATACGTLNPRRRGRPLRRQPACRSRQRPRGKHERIQPLMIP